MHLSAFHSFSVSDCAVSRLYIEVFNSHIVDCWTCIDFDSNNLREWKDKYSNDCYNLFLLLEFFKSLKHFILQLFKKIKLFFQSDFRLFYALITHATMKHLRNHLHSCNTLLFYTINNIFYVTLLKISRNNNNKKNNHEWLQILTVFISI